MKIIAGEVSGPASLIHFSLSPDSKFFTLLIYVPGEKGSGSEIIALIFSTSWRLNIEPRGNSEYIYLRGPGTAAPWDTKKPLNIEICGNNIPRSEIVDIQKGIEVWLPYISNATQNRWAIKIHETKNGILPFTDFSQHCIFVIDDFLMEPDPRLGTFGITTSVIDSSASQIIDSDVMIFRGEFKKFNSSASPSEIYRAQKITAIHEMGHFFGLGHQFNGEASVMSYKFKDLSPTKYDIDAITELYKQ